MRKFNTWWITYSVPWPIECALLGQRTLAILLYVLHVFAALAVLSCGLAFGLKIILLLAVAISLFLNRRRWILGVDHLPQRLNYTLAQGWFVTLGSGEKISVVFIAPFWLTPWVSFLRVAQLDAAEKVQRKFPLIIFPQSTLKEDYRRLLMLLNFPKEN